LVKPFSTAIRIPEAVLVSVISKNQTVVQVEEYLNELEFLAGTAGIKTIKKFTQKLEHPDPRSYVGKGRLEDIVLFVTEHKPDVVIFDDELSPSQIRNIEKALKCQVLDRTNLILDIFARRARTAQAKTQVELAQYKYLLPRLTRMWTHLERQKGGIGMRGPGETELETDRRVVRDKLASLRDKLEQIDKQNQTQRKRRGNIVKVSLVGYTNVGKSTIMNMLSKSDVFAENKLFATLDTTVRKVVWDNIPFLLSDTVGFIRKLPHDLIESFKSTLDEVREADILVHVLDISHPNFEEQMQIVQQTLVEINSADKPTLLVFNKTDAYQFVEKDEDDLTPETKENVSLVDLEKSWMAQGRQKTVFISALQKKNIQKMRELLLNMIKEIHYTIYPHMHDGSEPVKETP